MLLISVSILAHDYNRLQSIRLAVMYVRNVHQAMKSPKRVPPSRCGSQGQWTGSTITIQQEGFWRVLEPLARLNNWE